MSLKNRYLSAQIRVVSTVEARLQSMQRRLLHLQQDQRGQTPTEYLMIVGLMAALIVTIFTVMFWPTIRGAAGTWSQKVSDAISGRGMQ